MIVVNLRAARQRAKMKQGRCEGRKPFRYYPGEVSTLKGMKELYASGLTATDIAAPLPAEGSKTRNGGEWLQATVSKILNRESA
jgi:hypothetical protein